MKQKEVLRLNFSFEKTEEYYIYGIENRIEQIIANLLDNSISFSEDNKNIVVETFKDETIK
jgi:two-component system sensor histidine kinase ChvG